jgi:hypothetical protein
MKQGMMLAAFLFMMSQGFGQSFEKIQFSEKNKDDYYLALKPQSGKINGVLVLLPGYAGKAEDNFPETKLFNVAYINDVLSISISEEAKIFADELVIERFNLIMADIVKRYSVSKDRFVLGGFSAGGTLGMRYAEYCVENSVKAPIIPRGFFAVDSPLDLISIWNYFQREMKKNYSETGVNEAKAISAAMNKEIGTPQTNPKRYNELTPFNHELNEPGNERHLKNIAVRVYEDIDVEWQLKNRRRSIYDSNALDASELINRLILMGNDRAQFITSKQPGRRSNGMWHPHSWSIVDEIDCIQWCLNLFEAK